MIQYYFSFTHYPFQKRCYKLIFSIYPQKRIPSHSSRSPHLILDHSPPPPPRKSIFEERSTGICSYAIANQLQLTLYARQCNNHTNVDSIKKKAQGGGDVFSSFYMRKRRGGGRESSNGEKKDRGPRLSPPRSRKNVFDE